MAELASPAKPAKLPAAVANASHEELQKMVVDLLRKLKAKDKKLQEQLGNPATVPNGAANDLTQQVSSLQVELQEAHANKVKEHAAREALEQQTARLSAALEDAQQDAQAAARRLEQRTAERDALQDQLGDRDANVHALQLRVQELESTASQEAKYPGTNDDTVGLLASCDVLLRFLFCL